MTLVSRIEAFYLWLGEGIELGAGVLIRKVKANYEELNEMRIML